MKLIEIVDRRKIVDQLINEIQGINDLKNLVRIRELSEDGTSTEQALEKLILFRNEFTNAVKGGFIFAIAKEKLPILERKLTEFKQILEPYVVYFQADNAKFMAWAVRKFTLDQDPYDLKKQFLMSQFLDLEIWTMKNSNIVKFVPYLVSQWNIQKLILSCGIVFKTKDAEVLFKLAWG